MEKVKNDLFRSSKHQNSAIFQDTCLTFCTHIHLTVFFHMNTVNQRNFEQWGNFEHRPTCLFNDLYYQNGIVYQKLYFSLIVPITMAISKTGMCTYI